MLIICGEDGLADTVVPRLKAAGASKVGLSRAWALSMVPAIDEEGNECERLFSLVADIMRLEQDIIEHEVKLLIIDPITAYLGSQVDIYKDSEIRAALTPLAQMAERCGVAVLLVRHLSKDQARSALHAGLGGIGFIGIARLGMLLVENAQKEGERLLGSHKGNLTVPPPTLAYEIVQVRESESMVKVEWLGKRDIKITEAFRADREKATQLGRAMRFLREQLKDSDVSADDIFDPLVLRAQSLPNGSHTPMRAVGREPATRV